MTCRYLWRINLIWYGFLTCLHSTSLSPVLQESRKWFLMRCECSGHVAVAVSSRWMCCKTEKSLAILTPTPSTFRQRLRVIPGSGTGSRTLLPLRRLSLKITSQDLLQFNRRLFRFAHARIFGSSTWRKASLLAGMTKYVSSANLHSEFLAVAAVSAASPMTDPWTILAVMLSNDDHWSLNTVLWEWLWKKSINQLYTWSGRSSCAISAIQ